MPQWHGDLHKRKKTGGKKHIFRGNAPSRWEATQLKQLSERREFLFLGDEAGTIKLRALAVNTVNVTDPATGKSQKTEIRES